MTNEEAIEYLCGMQKNGNSPTIECDRALTHAIEVLRDSVWKPIETEPKETTHVGIDLAKEGSDKTMITAHYDPNEYVLVPRDMTDEIVEDLKLARELTSSIFLCAGLTARGRDDGRLARGGAVRIIDEVITKVDGDK